MRKYIKMKFIFLSEKICYNSITTIVDFPLKISFNYKDVEYDKNIPR